MQALEEHKIRLLQREGEIGGSNFISDSRSWANLSGQISLTSYTGILGFQRCANPDGVKGIRLRPSHSEALTIVYDQTSSSGWGRN